ncbi:MAG: Rid family hydrolase [Pseudomonadota bacterium]
MAHKRENFSTGSHFEHTYGYSRAVKVGETVYVSGTVGLNYDEGGIPTSATDQFDQIVANLTRGLAMAGARLEDVVQLVIYVTGADVFEEIGPSLKAAFGPIAPTSTAVVVAFPFPDIKLEISATAVIGCGN